VSIIRDCKEILKLVITYFRNKGYTDEDLSGGMDEAQKFLNKLNISTDLKFLLKNVIDDEKKNIDKK
jgi:hypothetical protein